jgi:hypothetical protein
MDITKYTDYFHDGDLFDIRHKDDYLELYMESCEIPYEDYNIFPKDIILSKEKTILGKLKISKVKNIKVNNLELEGVLKKIYDVLEILDFELKEKNVFLFLECRNYLPNVPSSNVSKIEIDAESIKWENIPNLTKD